MNYVLVQDPQPGDLVLYYFGEVRKPKHMGIYRGSNEVESKLGVMSSVMNRHPLFGVPSIYGNKVVFMRPLRLASNHRTDRVAHNQMGNSD